MVFRSRKTVLFGGLAAVLCLALYFLYQSQNPVMVVARALLTLWNRIMVGVDRAGFLAFPIEDFNTPLNDDGLVLFLSLISVLILSLSLYRKIRALPVLFFFFGTALPLFTFRMIENSIAFALLLACSCTIVIMVLWQKQKMTPPSRVGVLSLVLALAILLVPLTAIRKPLGEITVIQDGVKSVIRLVTDLYHGDGIFFSDPEEEGGYRTARSSKRKYRGITVAEVYADTNSTLYLRDYDGGSYDFVNSRWQATEVDPSVRKSVSGYRVSNKEIYSHFFDVFQRLKVTPEQMGWVRNARVTVVQTEERKRLLIPAGADLPTPVGESPVPVMNSNGYYELEEALSGTYSYVADYASDRGGESAFRFRQAQDAFSSYMNAGQNPPSSLVNNPYYPLMKDYVGSSYAIRANDCMGTMRLHYAQSVESEAIDEVLNRIFLTTNLYRYFNVRVISSADIQKYREADPLFGKRNGSFLSYDERVNTYTLYECKDHCRYADEVSRIVSSYLRDHYYYSTNPPRSQNKDAMEAFLLETKQGYCVQFATAGSKLS